MISITWNMGSFLSLTGLAFGLCCSLFLFYEWLKHRREQRFLLLWSISLTLFYIFLIPFIQVNFGETIVLADWNNFFISTIPLIFLGWVFFYSGIIQIKTSTTGEKSTKLTVLLSFWVLASFIFYSFRFSSIEYGKLLSIIGIFIFFIAIHIFILYALWNWFKLERWKKIRGLNTGIIFIAGAITVSIARYLLVLNSLTRLPRDFWFLSIASFDIVFILRSVVVILLAIGIVLVHKHYVLKFGI